MAVDNVTAIRAGSKAGNPNHGSSSPKRRPRRTCHERIKALVIEEPPGGEYDASTYDALAGLRGVCEVLDSELFESSGAKDSDLFHQLVLAARALSALVHNREMESNGPYRVLKEVKIPQEEGTHGRE